MIDFLTKLLDTSDFPPRWHCGNWTTAHGWLHIVSDLGVWSAYVAIPFVLGYFVLRRKDIPFRTIFVLFGAFILACGTTHLMEALLFWWPAYRLAGVIKLLTALVSWGTVLALIQVAPKALAMRSSEELEREIAARKEAEQNLEQNLEALRASEEIFRLLVEGSKDYAIFMLDPSGRIVSWNAGAERIKQHRSVEIVGQHFSRFYPAEDVQAGKPDQALRIAAAEGRYEEEAWRLRKDGSRFWASAVLTALRDEKGRLRGFSKITRDMTERKQAEENERRLLQEAAARRAAEAHAAAIAEERERLQVTLHSIGDAVIATDAAAGVTLLNPIAEALTGWTGEEAAGQRIQTVFSIINEKTRKKAENPVERVLREGKVVGLANHTVLTARDGTERPIDDSAAPIKNERGETLGVVLVFRDVSQRRRSEQEIHVLNRDLHRRVAELAQAQQMLQDADRRKNEFLAMLAHELRNPLAPIRNALELLRNVKTDPAMIEQAHAMMRRQMDQMVRLIDDLLDLSRISQGKISLRKERVELGAVVRGAAETVQPLLEAQTHELTIELPSGPIYLDADATRLAQVISNLLNNAVKYTDRGGHIWLTVERQGNQAVLSVRDTGIGIAAEHLPRLFEMFSQIAPARERSQGGLGIGLSLVRGLLQLHGGTVEARSDGIGKGSEFIVRLPVADSPLPAAEKPSHHTEARRVGPKRRILVADDNRDGADSLALMLSMTGHETRTAYNGLEAVQTAASFRPDVVLLDIGMPKMNGYEAARQIRNQPWGQTMALIALTGWGQEEDKRQALEAGFDHHLTKPVETAALEELFALMNLPTERR